MSNTSAIYTAGLIGQNIERHVLYLHYSFDHLLILIRLSRAQCLGW